MQKLAVFRAVREKNRGAEVVEQLGDGDMIGSQGLFAGGQRLPEESFRLRQTADAEAELAQPKGRRPPTEVSRNGLCFPQRLPGSLLPQLPEASPCARSS